MTGCRILILLDWNHLQDTRSLEMMIASHFDLVDAILSQLESFVTFSAFVVFTIIAFVQRGCISVCVGAYRSG